MSALNNAMNFFVIGCLCFIGYLVYQQSTAPVEPPADPWFQAAVVQQNTPVLVKFGADWCGPCRAMEPVLDQFAQHAQGRVAVVRIDVDKHPELASHYRVSSIPRMFLFEHGKVIADRVGSSDEQDLARWVQAYVPGT